MKFFNLDLHCAVIEDASRALTDLGHSVTSVNLSGHNWVMGRPSVPRYGSITPDTWGRATAESFFAEHKDLSSYDGFLVTYPPAFARFFERYDKPIVMYAPIRYELGYSEPDKWREFNRWIQQAVDRGQLHLAANSRYDQEYLAGFVERPVRYIPSLCDYANLQWSPSRPKALLHGAACLEAEKHIVASSDGTVSRVRDLYGTYKWTDIVQHQGFVHVPYNASVMSFFEHYSMAAPLFVPTPEFLLQLRARFSCVLSQITWAGASTIPAPHDRGDPNEAHGDWSSIRRWFPTYDFYNTDQHPHVLYFSSLAELRDLVRDGDRLRQTSERMKTHNIRRRERSLAAWAELLVDLS